MGEKSKNVKSKKTPEKTRKKAQALPKAKVKTTQAQVPTVLTWTASPLVLVGLGLVGLLLIFYVHSFRMTPSVLFLSMGWASILGAGALLWHAGLLLTAGDDNNDEAFVVEKTRRQELLTEKAALLKAIKEIEFDYQMGKLSDDDAAQITDVYRTRAIVILKELDSGTDIYRPDETLTVVERIERDIRARAEVAKAGRKAAEKARAIAKRRAAAKTEETEEIKEAKAADASDAKGKDAENADQKVEGETLEGDRKPEATSGEVLQGAEEEE